MEGSWRSRVVTCGHVGLRAVTCGHVGSRSVTCSHVWSRAVTCGHVGLRAVTFVLVLVLLVVVLQPTELVQLTYS